jgi:thiamine transporter
MKKSFKMTTREMVEIAFLIALAVVLDLAGIKIGHASFTMVPLFVLAYRHGFLKSLIVISVIYAVVTLLTDGWAVDLRSLILDYSLGYGVISLAGLFAKKIFKSSNHTLNIIWMVISVVLCSGLRILSSTISGVVVWELPFLESFVTNLTVYVGWDCLFALIVLPILYYPLIKINKIYPCSNI